MELTKSVEARLFGGASEFAGENLGTLSLVSGLVGGGTFGVTPSVFMF